MVMVPRSVRATASLAALTIGAVAHAQPAAQPAAASITFQPRTVRVDTVALEAELGRLSVPADHARPGAGRMELAVARLRSTAASPQPPIVFLAGGPGQSGIAAARSSQYLPLFLALRAVADVILLDQRGTGLSTPNPSCTAAAPPPTDVFASADRLSGYHAQRIRACVAEWRPRGFDPAHYDPVQSADDVDLLRRALGAAHIQLFGFSYGTHLAVATLRRHGAHVARAVLAGVEGPDDNWKLPSTMERQLERVSAIAAANPSVASRIPSPADTLRRILRDLERAPRTVTLPGEVGADPVTLTIGADGLRWLFVRDLGDSNDLPLYPAWIWTMSRGDDRLLAQFAAKRWAELRTVSLMSVATDCASWVSPARRARVEAEARTATLGDAANFFFVQRCAAVGRAPLPDDYRAPLRSDVPVLLVSGALDSQTPPEQAEALRRGLRTSAHVVVENAGHESTLPDPRVRALIVRFFGGGEVRDTTLANPPLGFRAPPR